MEKFNIADFMIFIIFTMYYVFYLPGFIYAGYCVDVTVYSVVCADLPGMVHDQRESVVPKRTSGAVRVSSEQNVCDDQFVGEFLDTGHCDDFAVLSDISRS